MQRRGRFHVARMRSTLGERKRKGSQAKRDRSRDAVANSHPHDIDEKEGVEEGERLRILDEQTHEDNRINDQKRVNEGSAPAWVREHVSSIGHRDHGEQQSNHENEPGIGVDRTSCQKLEHPHGCNSQAHHASLKRAIGLLKLSVRRSMCREYLLELSRRRIGFSHK